MYDNEYYGSSNDYRNYLSHHGIKGQKWGVRHGPPYPLEKATSSGIIKRSKKKLDKKQDNKKASKSKKKSNNMITQQHIRNHQEMVRMHNNITQQHIHQVHHTMMFGKDSPKENVKVELKNKDLESWEQNWYEDGYVVENPDGFSEGTTLRHLNNKKNSNGEYRFGTDYEEEYSITSGDSLLTFTKYHRIKNDNSPSDKQLASIQKSYLKNQSKIEKGILNNIADFVVNDPYGWNTKEGMDSMGLKTKNDVIKALRNDKTGSGTAFTVYLYPEGYGKEGGSNYVTGEFWSGDATLYGYHAIVQEFVFDPKTGEYKANPKGISLQG